MALPKVRVTVQYEDGPEFCYQMETLFDGEPAYVEPHNISDVVQLLSEVCTKDVLAYHHANKDIEGALPDHLIYSRENGGTLLIYDWQTGKWEESDEFTSIEYEDGDFFYPQGCHDGEVWEN